MKITQPYVALTFPHVNEQLREIYELLNGRLNIDNLQSLAGMLVLEADIIDGNILARLVVNEIIMGNWTHTGNLTVASLLASANLDIGAFSFRAARLEVDDALTYMDRDASGNLMLTDAVTGTMTLAEMSCPPLVTLSAVTQAEGNLSLAGFRNKVLIKWIRIKTLATDWNLTLFKKNTFLVADAFQVVNGKNGDYDIYLDYPYSDEDGISQLHINFTDVMGVNTYDIEVRGFALR